MPANFETPPELFVSLVGILFIVLLFGLGGWAAFFEPYKAPKDAD